MVQLTRYRRARRRNVVDSRCARDQRETQRERETLVYATRERNCGTKKSVRWLAKVARPASIQFPISSRSDMSASPFAAAAAPAAIGSAAAVASTSSGASPSTNTSLAASASSAALPPASMAMPTSAAAPAPSSFSLYYGDSVSPHKAEGFGGSSDVPRRARTDALGGSRPVCGLEVFDSNVAPAGRKLSARAMDEYIAHGPPFAVGDNEK